MANRRRRRPTERIVVSPSERTTLEQWTRRRTTSQGLAQRARIVLACTTGRTDTEIGRELHLTRQTVSRWRRRFQQKRLDGLLDEPRPGAPRKITDAMVERVIADTLETTPRAATHWSTRTLAPQVAVSASSVGRIWWAFGLQPHRYRDVQALARPAVHREVRDIVGLYLDPPDRALVLCVDEQSQIQALDRMAPILPMAIGLRERRTHDYRRHGTTSFLRRSTSRRRRSLGNVIVGTAVENFNGSSTPSRRAFPRISTTTSFSTTTARTRRRAFVGGSSVIHGFRCTSPRPARRG